MPSKGQGTDGVRRGRRSPLEQLDRLFDECAGPLLVQRATRKAAYRRARSACDAAAGNPRAAGVALLVYARDVCVAHAVELAAHQDELRALTDRIDTVAGIPRVALACEILGAPQLLQLPTAVAIEVELALLVALTEARAVSLWTLDTGGDLKQLAHAGDFDADARRTRRLAQTLLDAKKHQDPDPARDVAGILLERWRQPDAALIARGREAAAANRRAILECAGSMLTAMLERDQSRAHGSHPDEAVAASAERRLSRLRFDLHDGPQQDVVLLAEDVRLLRSQLQAVMDGQPNQARVLGRLDDLQARLVAIDGDLRRISAFVQSPFLQEEALPEALAKLTDEFAARTGIEPDTELDGAFTDLTDSQQITLLGLIREALSNIREHSDAEHVTIKLSAGADGVEATVTDDGQGFDPETTLVKAARDGHLGLVGMHERVHLLGGRTQIDSRPGGPTVISVTLPKFERPPETFETAGGAAPVGSGRG